MRVVVIKARSWQRMRSGGAVLWALAGALVAPNAKAAAYPPFGPNDVQTAFFISKSDDRNRVDYWMRLDGNCQPTNDEAVTPYWREFEKAPPVVTHSLGLFANTAYGIAAQRVASRSPNGADYALRLKAVGRPIGITTISGVTAELLSIYVKLSGPLSVEYIDIKGRDFRNGKPIVERMKK